MRHHPDLEPVSAKLLRLADLHRHHLIQYLDDSGHVSEIGTKAKTANSAGCNWRYFYGRWGRGILLPALKLAALSKLTIP